MQKLKKIAAFSLCLMLFLGAVLFFDSFSQDATVEFEADTGHVVISEIMASNRTYPAPNGAYLDFIEVHNLSATPTDISGFMLSDSPDSIGYTFPKDTVLPPYGYTVCWCDREAESDRYAAFGISKSGGETLYLYNAANVLVDEKTVPRMDVNSTLIRNTDGTWAISRTATPGYPNTEEGYTHWLASMGAYQTMDLVVSEVMAANRSTLLSPEGTFDDWLELTNTGDTPISLSGIYLSDDPYDPLQWQLPAQMLQPGESYVIFCGGERPEDAPFRLGKSGCSLILTGPLGNTLQQLDVPKLGDDCSWAMTADGTYLLTDEPTPGFPNTGEGRSAYLYTQQPMGPLVISEVMPSNAAYLQQPDLEYYDWVELVNVSENPIDLSDFSLSDDGDTPEKFPLPEQLLQPGERVIVICSGNAALQTQDINAPFTLSREESWLYVYHNVSGSYSDFLRIHDVPYQGSMGRCDQVSGACYFDVPTPGSPNGSGVSHICSSPVLETADGVFNNVDQVVVTLSGEGEIRYTLDGSVPNEASPLYSQPIALTSTTVLRAASFAPGMGRSNVVTGAYIINENHTLPVLSVAAEPNALFGAGGIYINYTSEEEVPCNLKLFENGEGFDIDCSIKMFGHTGLMLPKKSFKINFRNRYGGLLEYPVYGEDGPYYYESILIRAGQDYNKTVFRDELFASLAREMSDDLLCQRDKFCILYINGEYFGIYCLKEAFSETYYAENKQVSADSVTIVQAPVAATDELYQLMQFCLNNDMTDPDNYAYACSQIDIDSLIDWMIMEGYSTNGDVQQNLRYFRSTETGNKWQMALYDLDWAFVEHRQFQHVLDAESQPWQHQMITASLARNPEFRLKLIKRTSELLASTLSDDYVLSRIDQYAQLLEPEMRRERERWYGTYDSWLYRLQEMRDFITVGGQTQNMINALRYYLHMTNEEVNLYFGRWMQ